MSKLDLTKFRKSSSDKQSATLKHPDGHEIKIALSALSPKMRAELHALPMADGGSVPEPDKKKAEQAQREINTPLTSEQMMANLKSGLGFAEGGTVKPVPGSKYPSSEGEYAPAMKENYGNVKADPGFSKYSGGMGAPKIANTRKMTDESANYADGGEVADNSTVASEMTSPSSDSPEKIVADAASQANTEAAPMAESAPQSTPVPTAYDNIFNKAYDQQAANNPGQPDEFTERQATGVADQAAANQAFKSAQPPVEGNLATQQTPLDGPSTMPTQAPQAQDPYTQMVSKGLGEQEAGIRGQAAAEGQLGRNQAETLNQQVEQQNNAMSDYKMHSDKIEDQRNAYQQDLANHHIDPNRYMGSFGTGDRIKLAIGMFLAHGSGPNGTNPLMTYIDKMIDRDIDAQKAELGKKETLLSANMKHFGDLRDSTLMTNMMMKDTAATQLAAQAAQSSDPMAKAKAQIELGKLHSQNALLMSQLAASRTLGGANGNNIEQYLATMRVANPPVAKEVEARYVPGVGLASVPLSETVRGTLAAKQNLDERVKDMHDWAMKHSGTLNPAVVSEGKAKAAELQSMYRNAINGGVFKEGEQKFIDSIIDSDPTKFFNNIRVLPKLREVMASNRAQLDNLKRSYGIKAMGGASASPSSTGFTPKSFKPSR